MFQPIIMTQSTNLSTSATCARVTLNYLLGGHSLRLLIFFYFSLPSIFILNLFKLVILLILSLISCYLFLIYFFFNSSLFLQLFFLKIVFSFIVDLLLFFKYSLSCFLIFVIWTFVSIYIFCDIPHPT